MQEQAHLANCLRSNLVVPYLNCSPAKQDPRNHSWTFCRGDTSANGGRSITMLAKDFQTVLISFKSQHIPNPFSEKQKKTKLVGGFNPFEKY